MLEKFRQAKEAEVRRLQELAASGQLPPPYAGVRPSFVGALAGSGPRPVIAEYKRASPSKGDINLTCSPEQAAESYALAGAAALSVLTEEVWFKGNMACLSRMAGPGLPLLRKDFIIHPLQVDQTAASPASAMLLIVRMLDAATLAACIARSRQCGLEPVVEIFAAEELDKAREGGARIIQVNNRDLDSLRVDVERSRRLAARKEPGEFWITASGVDTARQLDALLALGFDAALIGSAFMGGPDPGARLARLLGDDGAGDARG